MIHIFSDNNNIWVAHFKTFNCFMTQALVFQISLSFAAEPFFRISYWRFISSICYWRLDDILEKYYTAEGVI